MASRGVACSSFPRFHPSSCASLNSSFSIRNLLNLPEENTEECARSFSGTPPVESCPVSLPLVPRAVRPLVRHCGENLSGISLLNWREFELAPHFRPWGGSVPFAEQGFPIGINIFQRKRRRPMRKKKQRPLFSAHQIQTMEKEFAIQRYVTEDKRAKLATEVNLTETQVKTWFQNRRTKWRKENRDEGSTSSSCGVETRRNPQEGAGKQVLLGVQGNSFYQNSSSVLTAVHPFAFVPHFSSTARFPNFDMNLSFVA